ncbi:ABC transporter permease, partial [Bacillus thuringiensis]
NSIRLSRITVLQLVHADSKTDSVSVKGAKTVIFTVLGIILLTIGYASMIYMDKLKLAGIFIALITVTSGTYMF